MSSSVSEEIKSMNIAERFMRYCRIDTESEENAGVVPSTQKQFDLARLLVSELKAMGAADVSLDEEHCYVYGYVPATTDEPCPVIGFIAHMDTAPAFTGKNVSPRIIEYTGGDIVLENGLVTDMKTYPFLNELVGRHLVVTDGRTLLGADDKAGVVEIMAMAEYLLKHPEIRHGRIGLCFTPDEEVAHLAGLLDLEAFGAEYAYTLDGGMLGKINCECFNGAAAQLTIHGLNIHPGTAKGKMRNAILYANEFINMLPEAESPGHTEGYEGYYHVEGISGNESMVTVVMIIRDFEKEGLEKRKKYLQNAAEYLNGKYGEHTFELEITDTYRNMYEYLQDKEEIMNRLRKAIMEAGVEPGIIPIRGGTDGCALTFRGLPCPNLSTGYFNGHGPNELAVVEYMEKTVEILINTAKS